VQLNCKQEADMRIFRTAGDQSLREINTPLASGKRTERRARVALAAKLQTLDGVQRGHMLNLSCWGAMIETGWAARREDRFVLQCGHLEELVYVKWIDSGLMGVQFDEPIGENLVIEMRHSADAIARQTFVPARGRPPLSGRPLTDMELAAVEEWGGRLT
jgi:hypothetical protein